MEFASSCLVVLFDDLYRKKKPHHYNDAGKANGDSSEKRNISRESKKNYQSSTRVVLLDFLSLSVSFLVYVEGEKYRGRKKIISLKRRLFLEIFWSVADIVEIFTSLFS